MRYGYAGLTRGFSWWFGFNCFRPCGLAITPQLKWSFNPTLIAYKLGAGTTNGRPTYPATSPLRSINLTQYWNINQLSISYAFQPRLRIRLTLGRLTLPRNPWAYGEQVFHLFYRYSSLHYLFQALHQSLRSGFTALGMLAYRSTNPKIR